MRALIVLVLSLSVNLFAGESEDERSSSRDRDPDWDCEECEPVLVPAPYKKFNVSLFYGKGPSGIRKIVKHRTDDGSCVYDFYYKKSVDMLGLTGSYRLDDSWNVSALILTNDTKMIGFGFSF